MIELKAAVPLRELAMATMAAAPPQVDLHVLPTLPAIRWDSSFAPVELTPGEAGPLALMGAHEQVRPPGEVTYIVRGEVSQEGLPELEAAVAEQTDTVGLFSDPPIAPFLVCPGHPPMGTDIDVERLLCVPRLLELEMDGRDVLVAIVDSGVNLQHLSARGKNPAFDAARSWAYNASLSPGSMPVGHGTMCAYDTCIAAPRCTLADIVLLGGQGAFSSLLSDAVRAYGHLLAVVRQAGFFELFQGLVVNNSWGMFHPSWDFPVGHPGNYSDNPAHPFNVIVAALERQGADIVFAAGNCGRNCPDKRCAGVTASAIYGANSHPQVLSVAGVDVTQARVGYSSSGPGRLMVAKPDLCGYTHFAGSQVYAADGGTSAAAPVVAGVLAALRSQRRYVLADPTTHPAAIRGHLLSHCDPMQPTHSHDYGWGVVSGCTI